MRWKEIVGKLEDALAVTRIDPVFTTGGVVACSRRAIWSYSLQTRTLLSRLKHTLSGLLLLAVGARKFSFQSYATGSGD
jgi:hypothetical protein